MFVTAYDDFALQAFEASALDYLVKPVEPERLARSVARLEAAGAPRSTRDQTPFSARRWLFLDTPEAGEFLELASITHVTSDSRRSRIHTLDGRVMPASRTLAEWERRLPQDDFLRVHRGAIVNLRHVERVEPWSNYGYRVHLRGWDEPVAMSRRYARSVRERLR